MVPAGSKKEKVDWWEKVVFDEWGDPLLSSEWLSRWWWSPLRSPADGFLLDEVGTADGWLVVVLNENPFALPPDGIGAE